MLTQIDLSREIVVRTTNCRRCPGSRVLLPFVALFPFLLSLLLLLLLCIFPVCIFRLPLYCLLLCHVPVLRSFLHYIFCLLVPSAWCACLNKKTRRRKAKLPQSQNKLSKRATTKGTYQRPNVFMLLAVLCPLGLGGFLRCVATTQAQARRFFVLPLLYVAIL